MMIQGIITYSKSLNSFWWKPTEDKSIMWSDIMKLQNFKIKILKKPWFDALYFSLYLELLTENEAT